MINILEISINNNFVYVSIIAVLVVIIIVTILSIKKDRDKMVKKKIREIEQPIEPARTKEEQEHAKLELEKVVNSMKNDLEKKQEPSEIMTYEQEQEDKAIISYQELVAAVKKNQQPKPQSEIGLEVVTEEDSYEIPVPLEEKIKNEELNKAVDKILETPDLDDIILDDIKPANDFEDDVIKIKPKEEPKKFHTSEFISPIYGKHPQIELKKSTPEDKENDINRVVENDLKNTEDFLDSLKEFRNKL